MKNYLFLLLAFALFTACNTKPQYPVRKYIEPSEYSIMDYEVKNASYHDFAKQYVNDSYISIIGDSTFNVSKKLGDFFFKGNSFNYKIMNDSLILSNNEKKQSYKILDLRPNSFSIEVNNTYFKRIGLIKPLGKRRRIESAVELEF